jgi:RimJ/RimL family protein N-acetyltransferase
VELATEVDGLTLRPHRVADAEQLARLLRRDARHLLSHGDYAAEIGTTVEEWRVQLAAQDSGDEPAYSFAMWLDTTLMVGRIVLVPVDPPRYSVGYWVTESQQGKGFATASLRAITTYAASLGATEVFAGVRLDNPASRRVLDRAGFVGVADFPTYTRFWRPVGSPEQPSQPQTGSVEPDSREKNMPRNRA